MSHSRNRAFNRRKLLGASAGAGAAAILGGLGGGVAAAPVKRVAPMVRRSQETTKLSFWHLSPEQLEPFKKVMEEFTAAHPGIEVEVEMTPRDQYKAKLQTALNSGSGRTSSRRRADRSWTSTSRRG